VPGVRRRRSTPHTNFQTSSTKYRPKPTPPSNEARVDSTATRHCDLSVLQMRPLVHHPPTLPPSIIHHHHQHTVTTTTTTTTTNNDDQRSTINMFDHGSGSGSVVRGCGDARMRGCEDANCGARNNNKQQQTEFGGACQSEAKRSKVTQSDAK